MKQNDSLLKIEHLKGIVIHRATAPGFNEPNKYAQEYQKLREELISNPNTKDILPFFIVKCLDINMFWDYIKSVDVGSSKKYENRKKLINDEFAKTVKLFEAQVQNPSESHISEALVNFDQDYIKTTWDKALQYIHTADAEESITQARKLIEEVCKHILDEMGTVYKTNGNLGELISTLKNNLKISPEKSSARIDTAFDKILTDISKIVVELGAIRNELGSAHGKHKHSARPEIHHAELTINLAGSIALFLIKTWEIKKQTTLSSGNTAGGVSL